MDTTEFKLKGVFIELCNLLKLMRIANSGDQGKMMVADGIIETCKTAKICAGQVVECLGQKIAVTSA